VLFRGNQPWAMPAELERLAPGTKLDDRCEAGEETLMTKGIKCDGSPVAALAK
jgi:hypothetical protein